MPEKQFDYRGFVLTKSNIQPVESIPDNEESKETNLDDSRMTIFSEPNRNKFPSQDEAKRPTDTSLYIGLHQNTETGVFSAPDVLIDSKERTQLYRTLPEKNIPNHLMSSASLLKKTLAECMSESIDAQEELAHLAGEEMNLGNITTVFFTSIRSFFSKQKSQESIVPINKYEKKIQHLKTTESFYISLFPILTEFATLESLINKPGATIDNLEEALKGYKGKIESTIQQLKEQNYWTESSSFKLNNYIAILTQLEKNIVTSITSFETDINNCDNNRIRELFNHQNETQFPTLGKFVTQQVSLIQQAGIECLYEIKGKRYSEQLFHMDPAIKAFSQLGESLRLKNSLAGSRKNNNVETIPKEMIETLQVAGSEQIRPVKELQSLNQFLTPREQLDPEAWDKLLCRLTGKNFYKDRANPGAIVESTLIISSLLGATIELSLSCVRVAAEIFSLPFSLTASAAVYAGSFIFGKNWGEAQQKKINNVQTSWTQTLEKVQRAYSRNSWLGSIYLKQLWYKTHERTTTDTDHKKILDTISENTDSYLNQFVSQMLSGKAIKEQFDAAAASFITTLQNIPQDIQYIASQYFKWQKFFDNSFIAIPWIKSSTDKKQDQKAVFDIMQSQINSAVEERQRLLQTKLSQEFSTTTHSVAEVTAEPACRLSTSTNQETAPDDLREILDIGLKNIQATFNTSVDNEEKEFISEQDSKEIKQSLIDFINHLRETNQPLSPIPPILDKETPQSIAEYLKKHESYCETQPLHISLSSSLMDFPEDVISGVNSFVSLVMRTMQGASVPSFIFAHFSLLASLPGIAAFAASNPALSWLPQMTNLLSKKFRGKLAVEEMDKLVVSFLVYKISLLSVETSIAIYKREFSFLKDLYKNPEELVLCVTLLVALGRAMQFLPILPSDVSTPYATIPNPYTAGSNFFAEEAKTCAHGQRPFNSIEFLFLSLESALLIKAALSGKEKHFSHASLSEMQSSIEKIQGIIEQADLLNSATKLTKASLKNVFLQILSAEKIHSVKFNIGESKSIILAKTFEKFCQMVQEARKKHTVSQESLPSSHTPEEKKVIDTKNTLMEALQRVQIFDQEGLNFQHRREAQLMYDELNKRYNDYNQALAEYERVNGQSKQYEPISQRDQHRFLSAFYNRHCQPGSNNLARFVALVPFLPITWTYRTLKYISGSAVTKHEVRKSFIKDYHMFVLQAPTWLIESGHQYMRGLNYSLRGIMGGIAIGSAKLTQQNEATIDAIDKTVTQNTRLHRWQIIPQWIKNHYIQVYRAVGTGGNVAEEAAHLLHTLEQPQSIKRVSRGSSMGDLQRALTDDSFIDTPPVQALSHDISVLTTPSPAGPNQSDLSLASSRYSFNNASHASGSHSSSNSDEAPPISLFLESP